MGDKKFEIEKFNRQRVIRSAPFLERIMQRAIVEANFEKAKTAEEKMRYQEQLYNLDHEIRKTVSDVADFMARADYDGDVLVSKGKLLGNNASQMYIDEFDIGEFEPGLNELLKDVGEKEDEKMLSLGGKNIKRVTIECADGTTYTGVPVRVEGCPYDYRSMTVEAKIEKEAAGAYGIRNVTFANPATIVEWTDGTKTVVCCMDNAIEKEKIVNGKKVKTRRAQPSDTYSKEIGLAMCIAKKHYGNKGSFNEVFKRFIPEYSEPKTTTYIEDEDKGVVEVTGTGTLRKLSPEEAKEVKEKFFGGGTEEVSKPKRATNIDDGKIKALSNAGWPAEEIAKEMNISVATVYNHLKAMREE